MAKALILGINGQDGSYLADLLIAKDYTIAGWLPKSIPTPLDNISHLLSGEHQSRIQLIEGDLANQREMFELMEAVQPDEVYNLAAPSFPAGSWEQAVLVGDIAGLGVARLLEAIRRVRPQARFYQASTSEMFGEPVESPQSERTPFHPRNPYGVAKLYAHWTVVNARQKHGLYAVSGILFNHESPRRGLEFVTRKITHTAARIKLGLEDHIALGNLDARRDWGYAGDYVEAIWQMLQQEEAEDLVIGTGKLHSVREFCRQVFSRLELDADRYVIQDTRFFRSEKGLDLVADPRRAREKMGWIPKTSFDRMLQMMVENDLATLLAEQEGNGHRD